MKNREIKTIKSQLFIVEIPDTATDWATTKRIVLWNNGLYEPNTYVRLDGYEEGEFKLPQGNWQHIGTLNQMTEEVWKGIVDDLLSVRNSNLFVNYQSYSHHNPHQFKTATESGFSLLKANGVLLDNPHGNMPIENSYEYVTSHTGIEDYNRDVERWQEAQSKLFDPNRTHFFIKQD